MRNIAGKHQRTVIILSFLLLISVFGQSRHAACLAQAGGGDHPQLVADVSGAMLAADNADGRLKGEASQARVGTPQREPLMLLLLGFTLLSMASGIKLLSSRKNKPKSKPA